MGEGSDRGWELTHLNQGDLGGGWDLAEQGQQPLDAVSTAGAGLAVPSAVGAVACSRALLGDGGSLARRCELGWAGYPAGRSWRLLAQCCCRAHITLVFIYW